MTPRIVKLYPSTPEKDTIGFSPSCSAIPQDDGFMRFMQDRDYGVAMPIRKPEGQSFRYIESHPALSNQHILELGAFCVDFVRTFENGISVIDNRSGETEKIITKY